MRILDVALKVRRYLLGATNATSGPQRTLPYSERIAILVRDSALFDAAYYLEQRPDLVAVGVDPLAHFMLQGHLENVRPHPLFDPGYYRSQIPELEKDANPLVHYLQLGHRNDLKPHPLFDPAYYREQSPGLPEGDNALIHFVRRGYAEDRRPHPLFDPVYYRLQATKLGNNENPLVHFVREGHLEDLKPHLLFDPTYYLSQRPDLLDATMDPLSHFVQYGFREGINPHPLFVTDYYLSQRADVTAAGLDPLTHFVRHGYREGARPHPLFDPLYYRLQLPDHLGDNENALLHFLREGYLGDIKPHALFDPSFYRSQVVELAETGDNPLLHYIFEGYLDGLRPHPLFDPAYYVSQRPDVSAAGVDPLTHFIAHGYREDVKPHPLLDLRYYRQQIPGGINPLEHFMSHGLREGRSLTWQGARDGFFFHLVCDSLRARQTERAILQDRSIMDLDLWDDVLSAAGTIRPMVERAASVTTIRSAKPYTVPAVRIMDGPDWPEAQATLPAHEVARLNDVVAIGGSRLVITAAGELLFDEMSTAGSDRYGTKLPFIRAHIEDQALVHVELSRNYIDRGVLIASDADFNYFHWMLESLPKIELLEQAGTEANVPLLISQSVPATGLTALKRIIGDRQVIRLRDAIGYRVGTLDVPSDRSRVLSNYNNPILPNFDILIDPGAIDFLRARLMRSLPAIPLRKIFLGRGSGLRRPLNERRMRTVLKRRGFEIVDSGQLSLDEQIDLWGGAAIVVAPTGAALTNLVFAHPAARVLVLSGEHSQNNPHLFTQMGSHLGLEMTTMFGKRAYKLTNQYSVHDDYYVDLDAVLSWVEMC